MLTPVLNCTRAKALSCLIYAMHQVELANTQIRDYKQTKNKIQK